MPAPWDRGDDDPAAQPIPWTRRLRPPPRPRQRGHAALPGWITRAGARRDCRSRRPMRPSNALGAADHPDRRTSRPRPGWRPAPRREAALVGRLMHRLLQHLPAAAGSRAARRRPALPRPARPRAVAGTPAQALVGRCTGRAGRSDPGAAVRPWLAAPKSRIAATVAPAGGSRRSTSPARSTGSASRTRRCSSPNSRPAGHALPPQTPPTYLAQLALYRAAVLPLYPGKPVRAFLVWTSGPGVVEIAPAALDAALAGSRVLIATSECLKPPRRGAWAPRWRWRRPCGWPVRDRRPSVRS